MEDDIFAKVIETVRGVPSEYDSTVENITGKILSQNNLKHAEIHDRFVDEWNHSESPKDSIVIAWLLSDRFLGTGEPAVRTVFADRLLERIDPEDNRLNPERLQEWIRSVIFSDEESIETLRNALIASKQIPKTTSGKAVDKIRKQFLTLKSFIEIHCDLSAKPDVQSKVALLHEYNLKGKIKLPKLAHKYRKGQHKYYYVDDLKKNWPAYQEKMPTLPLLKVAGN